MHSAKLHYEFHLMHTLHSRSGFQKNHIIYCRITAQATGFFTSHKERTSSTWTIHFFWTEPGILPFIKLCKDGLITSFTRRANQIIYWQRAICGSSATTTALIAWNSSSATFSVRHFISVNSVLFPWGANINKKCINSLIILLNQM